MFKLLCLAALLAAASAQKCGRGTTLDADGYCVAVSQCGSGTVVDPATNKCVVAPTEDRARRENKEDPKIETLAKSLIFSVDEKASVGVKQSGSDIVQNIETSESAISAVVSAIKLGYVMNREIDQVKDLNKIRTDLTKLITDVSKESTKTSSELKSSVTEQQKTAKKSVDDALEAGLKSSEAAIKLALAAVDKSSKESAESLKKFKADTESTVSGLAKAVPAASCANSKQDGDETDVDCGGSCGKTCVKSKKCKFTTDCKASLCMSGTCNTCKSRSGAVSVKPGVTALCASGKFKPHASTEFIKFDTCGMTGERGPTGSDCRARFPMAPHMFSIHEGFVTYEDGFQVFEAPVDGTYKWYVVGAQGGSETNCCDGGQWYNRYGKGGQGGRVIASLPNVKAGTKFYIRAGQQGEDAWETRSGMRSSAMQKKPNCMYVPSGHANWDNGKAWYDPAATHKGFAACGGFNGGGPAIACNGPGGSSGGGSSDVRMCKNGGDCDIAPSLDHRFLVAGGGGGGSSEGGNSYGCGGSCRWGGHAGGSGTADNGYDNGQTGYGGRQDRGGRHESENSKDYGSSWGIKGLGGTGGRNDGGGGGGGYYGGGGARYNAGGGGGSSYVGGTKISGKPQVHNNDKGWKRGDGYVYVSVQSTN